MVAEQKINIQISVVFLYNLTNEQSKNEIKKALISNTVKKILKNKFDKRNTRPAAH